jgi:hypothetical protein
LGTSQGQTATHTPQAANTSVQAIAAAKDATAGAANITATAIKRPIKITMNTNCTSACGNDYDCPHEDQYENEDGSVKLEVTHLSSDYPKACERISPTFIVCHHAWDEPCINAVEFIADQEAKHGEARVASQD